MASDSVSLESTSTGNGSIQSFSALRRDRAKSAAARDQAVLVGMLTSLAQKLDDVTVRLEKLESAAVTQEIALVKDRLDLLEKVYVLTDFDALAATADYGSH